MRRVGSHTGLWQDPGQISRAMLAQFFAGELGSASLGHQAATIVSDVDGCGTFANAEQTCEAEPGGNASVQGRCIVKAV